MNTTVTFRTDEQLKKAASEIFEGLGMNLSTALNMFMRQAVVQNNFPCSLDLDITSGAAHSAINTYPAGFFELFGSGAGFELSEEPCDIIPEEVAL